LTFSHFDYKLISNEAESSYFIFDFLETYLFFDWF